MSIKDILRLGIVHTGYIAYYCVLFWRLYVVLEPFDDEWNKKRTLAAANLLCLVFPVIQFMLGWYGYKSSKESFIRNNTWCHLPMLSFLLFSIGPYGMFMHYQYKTINIKHKNITGNCTGNPSEILLAQDNFIVLQAAIPMLAITFLCYPYPKRSYRKGEIFAVAIEFLNAFDILDLVEDISYVQNHSKWLTVLFYLALAVSTILLAFPAGLEDDDDEDPKCIRITSTACTWIFTDFLFAFVRIAVMASGNYQAGFHFLMKNILALFIRPFLLFYGSRE